MLPLVLGLAAVVSAAPHASPAPTPVPAPLPTLAGSFEARAAAPGPTRSPALPLRARDAILVNRAGTNQDLADGILKNIDVQVRELAAVMALSTMLEDENKRMNTDAYLKIKTSLLDIQTSGTSIRENNQRIAPTGNAAIDGLKKVQGAQEQEISQVKQLTGNMDNDKGFLNQLVAEVREGTAQNAQNRFLALGNSLIGMPGNNATKDEGGNSSSSSSSIEEKSSSSSTTSSPATESTSRGRGRGGRGLSQ